MDPALIEQMVERMSADETKNGLSLVDTFVRCGSMTEAEAIQWRRRILARQKFLGLDGALAADG